MVFWKLFEYFSTFLTDYFYFSFIIFIIHQRVVIFVMMDLGCFLSVFLLGKWFWFRHFFNSAKSTSFILIKHIGRQYLKNSMKQTIYFYWRFDVYKVCIAEIIIRISYSVKKLLFLYSFSSHIIKLIKKRPELVWSFICYGFWFSLSFLIGTCFFTQSSVFPFLSKTLGRTSSCFS